MRCLVSQSSCSYSADAENGSDCSSTSSVTTVSLLDRLCAPAPSALARKRRVGVNAAPPIGKKRSSGQALRAPYVPKGITPSQRASEFPKEQLVGSAGKLFCKACKEILCLKRSVIQNHVKSSKHQDGKKALTTKETRERSCISSRET